MNSTAKRTMPYLQHFGSAGLVHDRKSSIHDAAGDAMKLLAGVIAASDTCSSSSTRSVPENIC
jgi:hypothetical protein